MRYTILSTPAVRSSTGIMHLPGSTRHTSADAAYAETERAVACKPTLAQPLAGNIHCGVGEGRCRGCEPSVIGRRSCRRTTSSRWAARFVLYSYVYHCCLLPSACVLLGRHDSLDSPTTLGIWVRSRRSLGAEGATRAEAAHAEGQCWGGPMQTLL